MALFTAKFAKNAKLRRILKQPMSSNVICGCPLAGGCGLVRTLRGVLGGGAGIGAYRIIDRQDEEMDFWESSVNGCNRFLISN